MGSRAQVKNAKCLNPGPFMRLPQYIYKPKKRTVKGRGRTYYPPQLRLNCMMRNG